MRGFLLRSTALPAMVTAMSLLIALAVMLTLATRSMSRIEPLRMHLDAMQRLQDQALALQYDLAQGAHGELTLTQNEMARLQRDLSDLARDERLLGPRSREHLGDVGRLLADHDRLLRERLREGLTLMHEILVREGVAHRTLLDAVHRQAQEEVRIAGVALVLLPLSVVVVLLLIRRRVLAPLAGLSTLLDRMGKRDFAPAPAAGVDPVLAPLMENYNRLVGRLTELEAQARTRRESLEAEVRTATRDLMEHNHRLAHAERLAAVGEMSASLAHELRNPLAGIDLALANVAGELEHDPDRAARIARVRAELQRITRLLNDLLARARQKPEEPVPVALDALVEDLFALVRYQVPEGVTLVRDIDPALVCKLPDARTRQVLLNLVLNAAAALGARGGTIRIRAERAGERLVLTVEDDGPGFSDSLMRDGIRAFRSNREGGTGLGLAIVRRFAVDLGGEVSIENLQPHGARVTLRLPCINEVEAA
jgi:C4-dicarboxylate-specific signal transduction histidine kinase